VSVSKNEENAPTGESANPRRKRRKDKLIRLDDLIPKQDIKGGRQVPFGATETTQTTNPTKKKQNATEGHRCQHNRLREVYSRV